MKKQLQPICNNFTDKADQQKALDRHLVNIETPRLVLREFTMDDVDAVYAITQRDGFAYHTFDGTRTSVENFIRKCIDDQVPDAETGQRSSIMLAVEIKDDATFIGFTSVETVHYPDGTSTFEPMFFIDPPVQNKGYGREAVVNIMKYAFDNLKIAGLNATIESENGPSLAVAYSLGYQNTGKEISFDTPQGHRTYMLLMLDQNTFRQYEAKNGRLFPQKAGNDNYPKQDIKRNIP